MKRIVFAVVALGGFALNAQELDRAWTFNFTEENDSLVSPRSDHDYTQGARISLASGERAPGDWGYETLREFSDAVFPGISAKAYQRFAIFAGQSFFTPKDLRAVQPGPREHPYAGWLYAGADVYRETAATLDRAGLALGVVGPASLADVTQRWYHDVQGGTRPRGWHNQLDNEPGLVLAGERKWSIGTGFGPFEVEALPEANIALGNVFSYIGAGGALRFGQGVGADWGPPRVQPGLSGSDFVNRRKFGQRWLAWYAYVGSELRLVGRNIFLDGNTFSSSASVNKRPAVVDLTGGLALVLPFGRAHAAYTYRTKEYDTQQNADDFLSITVSIMF